MKNIERRPLAPRTRHPDLALLIHAAARYAALAWPVLPVHGVLPDGSCTCPAGARCDRPGKHPARMNYLAQATTDPAVAASFFQLVPYSLALAVPADVCVIDADDAEALAHLRRWAPWPVGPTAFSGRGTHQFFRWPIGTASPSVGGLDGRHLDIRGHGDLCHLAPSRHASGTRYQWAPGLAPWETPLPLLPGRFAEHVARVATSRQTPRPAADAATLDGALALAHRRAQYAARASNGVGRGAAGLRRTLEEAGAPPHAIQAALDAFHAEAGR